MRRVPLPIVRRLRQAWLAAMATLLTVFAGIAAHGAWRSIGHGVPVAQVTAGPHPATGFPTMTAALSTPITPVSAETAAPAAGVTGTIALPDVPVPAVAPVDAVTPLGIGGVVPAAPFRFGRATTIDRGRALECLTAAVYYEAASEPDEGQQAVAQVVLNRVRHPAFPGTVCGVVYQGSERRGCQFSFACDGAMARLPSRAGWARAARVAAMALAGRVYAPVGLATHYHTYAVTPAWNRSLVMTDVVGAHFFHRWKGWWGTAAAFNRVYGGGEPVPGPHATIAPPSAVAPFAVPDPATTAIAAAAPVPPAATGRPDYADTGTPAVIPAKSSTQAPDDRLPPPATVRPEYADSGKPL